MAADHLNGLIRYLGQDDWKECFEEVLGDHLGPALEAVDMTFEDLGEILGPDVAMTLWGCAFEDFLGQDWDEGRNFVEVYLKRRGWKEGPRNSAYMRALMESVMSLYEVSDIVPGQSLMARDMLRGGKPVLVREGTATKTLRHSGHGTGSLPVWCRKMVIQFWPVVCWRIHGLRVKTLPGISMMFCAVSGARRNSRRSGQRCCVIWRRCSH